jgi:predicted O-methyltransferase YrrM
VTGELSGNIPLMVRAAHVAAERLGIHNSCSDEVGHLLQVLAGQFPGETICEIGGGCGVGTAWLAAGLPADSHLITIDSDEASVASVRSQFNDHGRVESLLGDWRAALQRGPFAMMVVQVSEARHDFADDVIDALRPGGLVVIDDLTPVDHMPAEWPGDPGTLRQTWLDHPRMHAVEIMVSPASSVILATRRR